MHACIHILAVSYPVHYPTKLSNIKQSIFVQHIPIIFQCEDLPRFTYDYAECAVHGCEDFNIDWLKEAIPERKSQIQGLLHIASSLHCSQTFMVHLGSSQTIGVSHKLLGYDCFWSYLLVFWIHISWIMWPTQTSNVPTRTLPCSDRRSRGIPPCWGRDLGRGRSC